LINKKKGVTRPVSTLPARFKKGDRTTPNSAIVKGQNPSSEEEDKNQKTGSGQTT